MNARQFFFDLVTEMREAQVKACTTFDMDDIRHTWDLEQRVDAEIEIVNKILATQAVRQ